MESSDNEGVENKSERIFAVGEKVRVERGDGTMEEDWIVVTTIEAKDGGPERVRVINSKLDFKTPTIEKLREWNP